MNDDIDLNKAKNYSEWLNLAFELDKRNNLIEWRKEEESDLFHSSLIREHITLMKEYRSLNKGVELISVVQESLSRHFWELNNSKLYTTALSGTKYIIAEYFEEIEKSINYICDAEIKNITSNDKLEIFTKGNKIHGNTALLLSGGASFGIYHLGVIKALLLENLIPDIISGSSMGAIVAGCVCTKTNDELREMFSDLKSIHRVAIKFYEANELVNRASILDPEQLLEHIQNNVADLTFLEAYKKTGRTLNITVSATRKRQRPRVLNYLTTPNLLIQNSILASCALPGIFPPVSLLSKNHKGEVVTYMESEKWIDGSVHLDIPMQRIIRLHNVSRSIVSQANPHVLPFIEEEKKKGIFPFITNFLASTLQTQFLKLLEAGVDLSEKMPWLSAVDKIRSMIDQEYIGDINIYYPMTLDSVYKIFANPTQEEFENFIRMGELATWPKIEFIKDQMKLNNILNNCISKLK